MRGIDLTRSEDWLHGTLDLLILRTLESHPMHGYAIRQQLSKVSGDVLDIEHGSLYPCLYRLERRGWIKARWQDSELGRKAKVYRMTALGRRELGNQLSGWTVFTEAVDRVIRSAASAE